MRIAKSIFDAIIQRCPLVPPETGGIMGGHGDMITDIIFDISPEITEQAVYQPDVIFLNNRIAWWRSRCIEFRGMFHSHPQNQHGLSGMDKDYIIKVMTMMPETCRELYFPIVIPQKKYKCVLREEKRF